MPEGLFFLIVISALYFLPSMIAYNRKVKSIGSLVVVNIFLGWTFIGWVVALAWSFTHNIRE